MLREDIEVKIITKEEILEGSIEENGLSSKEVDFLRIKTTKIIPGNFKKTQ